MRAECECCELPFDAGDLEGGICHGCVGGKCEVYEVLRAAREWIVHGPPPSCDRPIRLVMAIDAVLAKAEPARLSAEPGPQENS